MGCCGRGWQIAAAWRQTLAAIAVAVVAACVAGCSQPIASFEGNAVFAKRMEIETGSELSVAQAEVTAALERVFGTPDRPLWPVEGTLEQLIDSSLDASDEALAEDELLADEEGGTAASDPTGTSLVSLDRLRQAAGPVNSLEDGTNFGLYRKHCIACHGVAGDGVGPAAKLLNPYPRDFRLGKFKFTSTPIGTKPSRDDLRRTLAHGIPGTSMPRFNLLSEEDTESLIDYVIYLSVRGEVERAWLREAALEIDYDGGERLLNPSLAKADPEEYRQQWQRLLGWVDRATSAWEKGNEYAAERRRPEPPDDLPLFGVAKASQSVAVKEMLSLPGADSELAASIERGKELYLGDVASCAKCHGVLGLGEGLNQDYDDWTKDWSVMAGLQPMDKQQLRPMLKLGALPPRTISPRNLRSGVWRGGSRPIDVYWRIVHGIEGTPMPAAPLQPDNPLGLSQRDVWDLVNYVLSLPHEPISQK